MTTYTIEYTETENLAMQYVSASVDDWIQNVAHERARLAIDEIVQLSVAKFLEIGEPTPGTKEEIVSQAYSRGWVITGAQRNAESLIVMQNHANMNISP